MELKDSIKEIISEIEKSGDVKAVFGNPIKEGDIIIIPVASVCLAGGGGGGDADEAKSKGFGLGYKKMARPVGYIKIENGQVGFEPITDWLKLFYLAAAIFGLGSLVAMKLAFKLKRKKWEKCHQA